MEDIAPALLEELQQAFAEKLDASDEIRRLLKAIRDGTGTYIEAGEYGWEVGNALAEVFGEHLSSAVLPDGRMYFNIADRVVRPLLEQDHALVADAAQTVQQHLNEKAELGLKAQAAPLNEDRIDGIIDRVSNAEFFDDAAWILGDPVRTFSQSVVDDTLRANVDFQGKAGLSPKIIRKATGKCCKWCQQLAGTYRYPVENRDVYRRHNNCRCVVMYDPADGSKKMRNIHTKQWTDPVEDDKLIKRQFVGLRSGNVTIRDISTHALERIHERNVTLDALKDAIENPLETSPIKYDENGRPSVKITGRKATLSVNPSTGIIATVYPTHTKTAKKLSGRK